MTETFSHDSRSLQEDELLTSPLAQVHQLLPPAESENIPLLLNVIKYREHKL